MVVLSSVRNRRGGQSGGRPSSGRKSGPTYMLVRPAGSAEGRTGVVREGGKQEGRARVMFHDGIMIPVEVYNFNLASPGGPSARTIVPYSPPRPTPKMDGLGGWKH